MAVRILIVGAGPAGLATAGALAARGLHADVVEQAAQLGASWRGHYDRLCLHTVKELSALPGLPIPETAPRYLPRAGFVDYLERYAAHFEIRPKTGRAVVAIAPRRDGGWLASMADGRRIAADTVVVATGANRKPRHAPVAGLDGYRGAVVQSRDYRNGAAWKDLRVLVVGLGNTGAEIALDLAEHGAITAVAVRSAVNIVRRDVLGRPTQRTAILLSRLPRPVGDRLAAWFRDLTVGDLRGQGLRTSPLSPLRQLRDEGRTPVIDVGTVDAIRRGRIRVYPAIDHVTHRGVRFVDGSGAAFDAIVLATGYDADLPALFPMTRLDLDGRGLPRGAAGSGATAGLHFVGFDVRQPGGQLRSIAQQAVVVADSLAQASHRAPPPLTRAAASVHRGA